ncbi:MAG: SLC13 family permease [Rhodospirillales bacterium]|nr:MAG: SLC13 family permease [Rhodospirillales bacterium]
MFIVEPTFHMWATFAVIGLTLALYATEKAPMEVISMGVVAILMLLFQIFPLPGPTGENLLGPYPLLRGFANPALVTVLALLVMGQGMARAGLLDVLARAVFRLGGGHRLASVVLVLAVAIVVSAFLNNTPVVIMFIPIMQALASRFQLAPSKLMIPLSYAAILGGMTTLVGSSTNLLVNSAMVAKGVTPFTFFEFTMPGTILAAAGLVYVIFVAPYLLPSRSRLADTWFGSGGRQFIAQLSVTPGSPLIGRGAPGGLFASLPDVTVRMVVRGEEAILPPFEGYVAEAGDVLVVAASRRTLTGQTVRRQGLMPPDVPVAGRVGGKPVPQTEGETPWGETGQVVAEVMVAPASRFEGQTLRQIAFHHQTRCVVLGIQRRSRMIRTRMTDIRLEAGDVLLVQGQAADVNALKANRDVVLIEWSAEELAATKDAPIAAGIFVFSIGIAAADLLPLVVTTLIGAVAMVALGVLNVRQASRSVDPRIVTMIGAALALSLALEATGGARYLAMTLITALEGASPVVMLSVFFLFAAATTNIISNNAVAVLFTPIGIDMAFQLGLPPHAFAVAIVFAASCAFASPIGYQTNLLVLGPGHYRFMDFAKAGIPLLLLIWLVFTLVVPWWYGI